MELNEIKFKIKEKRSRTTSSELSGCDAILSSFQDESINFPFFQTKTDFC